MSGQKSSSSNSTVNTTTIQNNIDTKPLADAVNSSSELFAQVTKQGQESLKSFNSTLQTLIAQNATKDDRTMQVLKVGSIVVGAGLVYYIGKNKTIKKRGK